MSDSVECFRNRLIQKRVVVPTAISRARTPGSAMHCDGANYFADLGRNHGKFLAPAAHACVESVLFGTHD